MSRNNGWNNNQLHALGITRLTKGWVKALLGQDIEEDRVKEFIRLKDYHFRNKIDNKKPKGFPSFLYCDKNTTLKDQYKNPNWQKMRLFILNRDKFMCVECLSSSETLHVHHLKYKKNDFIWSVPHWYLVTLCENCHSEEHGRDLTIK